MSVQTEERASLIRPVAATYAVIRVIIVPSMAARPMVQSIAVPATAIPRRIFGLVLQNNADPLQRDGVELARYPFADGVFFVVHTFVCL